MTAAGIWTAPATISSGLAAALQGAPGGTVGMGAVAVILTCIIYGFKLRPAWAAVYGLAAASIFAEAGGIWSLGAQVLASGINQVLGA